MKRIFKILMLASILLSNLFAQSNSPQLKDIGRLKDLTSLTPNNYNGSASLGNYFYMLGDGKVFIYDISDENNIDYKSYFYSPNGVRIWSGENYLFIYTGNAIQIYDADDRTNPVLSGSYNAAVDLHYIRAAGNFMFILYMFDYNTGKNGSLEIVDISDPSNPSLKDSFKPGDIEGRSFCFSDDLLKIYTAHYNYSIKKTVVHELDISNPSSIVDLRTFTCSGAPVKLDYNNGVLFLLKDNEWSGPARLEAYSVPATGDWSNLQTVQVGSDRAWDMHVFGNSITLSLMGSGIKDYTWDSNSQSFVLGQSLNIPNASHLSWYVVKSGTTGQALKMSSNGIATEDTDFEKIIYTIIKNLAEYSELSGIETKVITKSSPENDVTLTMAVSPADAFQQGCSVIPSIGPHVYKLNSSATIVASAGENGDWVFKEWRGDYTGTNQTASIKMDGDKSVTAVFEKKEKVTLTVEVGPPDALENGCTVTPAAGTHQFNKGDNVTLIAKADDGGKWEFFDFQGDISAEGMPKGMGIIVMDENKTVKVDFKRVEEVTLTITIFPPTAAQYCSTNPAAGNHQYVKNTEVTIEATDDSDNGWVFDHWEGASSASSKTIEVIMDDNKNLIALFKELELSASGTKEENLCSCDINDTPIMMTNTEIYAYGENWLLTGLQLKSSGEGNEKENIKSVTLKNGSNLIWEGTYSEDNGNADVLLASPIKIEENSSITVTTYYQFNYDEEDNTKLVGDYNVKIIPFGHPEENTGGLITGNSTGSLILGQVFNNQNYAFNKITDALNHSSTTERDYIRICPGNFQENIHVDRKIDLYPFKYDGIITIEPEPGNLEPIISVLSEDVSLKGLTLKNSNSSGVQIDNQKDTEIIGCFFYGAPVSDIAIKKADNIRITGSHFKNLKLGTSIFAESPGTLSIDKCNFVGNRVSISVYGKAGNVKLSGCTFSNDNLSVLLSNTNNCIINGNEFSGCVKGIYESSSEGNVFLNNDFQSSLGFASEIEYGISSEFSFNTKMNNNTFKYCKYGIKIKNSESITVDKSKINLSLANGIDIKNSKKVDIENNEINRNVNGIEIDNSKTLMIVSNGISYNVSKANLNYGNEYGNGILMWGNNNGAYIHKNKFTRNCTDINQRDNPNDIVINDNYFIETQCSNTSIHLYGGSPGISGNSFIDCNGAAIITSEGANPVIRLNNFAETELALTNENPDVEIDANNNFWGNDGPSESQYEGYVSINDWLDSPVTLRASFLKDTLYINRSGRDSIVLSVQNVLVGNDSVLVEFSDNEGWLVDDSSQIVSLNDSLGTTLFAHLNIPAGGEVVFNNLKAVVRTLNSDSTAAVDSVVLCNYVQQLDYFKLSPDSVSLSATDSLQISCIPFDQYGNYVDITPFFVSSNGSIDDNGLFKPDEYVGPVTISAIDSASGIESSVIINVCPEVPVLNSILIEPGNIEVDFGEVIKFRAFGFDQYDFKMDLVPVWSCDDDTISQSGLFVAGYEEKEVIIQVTDTSGYVSAKAIVGIVDPNTSIDNDGYLPTSYTLKQNFPNPFNPSTTIEFDIPESGYVELVVYNLLGERITVLVQDKLQRGSYRLNWNANKNGIASGVYFYRLHAANGFTSVRKMLLVK